MVGEQAPGVREIWLQLHRVPERGDCVRGATSFAKSDSEFERHGRGAGLLASQRLKHRERCSSLPRQPVRCAENEPRLRVAGNGPQHFACLFGGEPKIFFEEPRSVGQRDIERADGV
jgi:hypothetical protein